MAKNFFTKYFRRRHLGRCETLFFLFISYLNWLLFQILTTDGILTHHPICVQHFICGFEQTLQLQEYCKTYQQQFYLEGFLLHLFWLFQRWYVNNIKIVVAFLSNLLFYSCSVYLYVHDDSIWDAYMAHVPNSQGIQSKILRWWRPQQDKRIICSGNAYYIIKHGIHMTRAHMQQWHRSVTVSYNRIVFYCFSLCFK